MGLLWRASLTRETWNVGWILSGLGSHSLTATGLTTFSMKKGPINQGASFLFSIHRGRSVVENHIFCPTRCCGAVVQHLLAHLS